MTAVENYVRKFDPVLLERAEGRRAITKNDPLLFAIIYLPDHLSNEMGNISLAEFHLDLLAYAKTWINPLGSPRQYRDAFIAPRSAGKSTWLFLILPIWAAAHGHQKFVAAFSDSATQAEQHLQTFKTELETNRRLQQDFPELCRPMKGSNIQRVIASNRSQTVQENGFVFMARGMDASNLGMKVGSSRPTLIILDDIEPGEANYSPYLAKQRLTTLLDDVLPLNDFARVAIVGTTTMPGSIIDQIRKVGEQKERYKEVEDFREFLDADLRWVLDENITVHYWPAIITDEDGAERSIWPEKWTIEFLNSIRHTRSFAKNMMNRPISLDAGYWTEEDILVEGAEEYGNTILSIDPAVTTAKASDYTGIAVLSRVGNLVYVRHAEQVKLPPNSLREHVLGLIERFKVGVVYVETNQGGDLWKQMFSGIPCKYRSVRQTEKKEVRAGRAFDFYQKGEVKHVAHFPTLEEQMLAFPRVPNDDVLDAVVSGVLYFKNKSGGTVKVRQLNYMEVA